MKKHKAWLSVAVKVAVFSAALLILFLFFINICIVRGNQMSPFLKDGQLVVIAKKANIAYDSVVLYRLPDGKEQLGRVIALSGNRVTVSGGDVNVDGNCLYSEIPAPSPEGSIAYPYTVGERAYFILNDRRTDVRDSRTYGEIAQADIIGTVVFTLQYRDI